MNEYLEIIQAIESKDPKGLEMLYDTYGTKFYDYCIKRWTLDEDEAWEVVYKTLETLVLKLPRYKFPSRQNFEGFLFKVLVNFIRQYYRSARKRNEVGLQWVDMNQEQDLPAGVNSQIAKTAFSEYYKTDTLDNPWLQKLNAGLAQMDTTDRDLLLLRAQEYTYEEIANLLGIENNQLKVRYHRAKQKLINLIGELK